ncbi:molybdenum cofactor biosynthesis protein MoaE [Lentisphaera profundi]|uniref:Molybdopterin synthase catalytic subunit n=1 Tax=Lentisphaera profundi TaxID=1658616 RepID=A0ABY7VPB7_9BACT|nr:molybdenum cofactor biosynthesis protein MoaE [Lentisphaera profundi]WDE95991.1 molybdenum cofactor biosynthesis protein MoaE [Lentisphaera profundi]
MQNFHISAQAIEDIDIVAKVATPQSGGYVIFDGRVRDHNENRDVTHLEYQAYEALAVKEGERIIKEAGERYNIHKVFCIHRTGDLKIGESAVRLIVSAKHRGTAFEACEFIIDELKTRVPIWKNEHYTDGSSGWVECHECSKHAHHEEH